MSIKLYDEEKQKRIRRGEEPFYFPITFSRIDRYQDCPRWYQFEYKDKLGHIGSDAAELGTALHVFQELLFTDGIEKANEIATAMVPLTMSEEWQNAKAIIEQITIKKDFLYAAEAKLRYEFKSIRVPKEGAPEPWTIQNEAKIDQLFVYHDQHTLEVIDGKSGRQVEKEVAKDMQLKLYCLTALKNLEDLDIRTVIGTQAQWRFGRLASATWTLDEMQEFDVMIERIATAMLNDEEFDPKPETHCMWCPHALRCDAAQTLLPKEVTIGDKTLPVIIDNDETATKVGEGILHLEAILARYRNSLRGFIREFRTPVRVGEKTFDWHRHATLKIGSLGDLLERANDSSIDLSPYISFNNTTGRSLIKKYPEIKEALVESQYEKFEYRKPGEEDE